MINHNVFIWLNVENSNPQDTALFEEKVAVLLSNSNIITASWGKSADTPQRDVTDKSFHYGLNIQFATIEAHNAFQVSSEHDEFVKSCGPMFSGVKIYDIATMS